MTRFVLIVAMLWATPARAEDACAEGEAALKAKDVTRASITVDECTALDPEAGAALGAKVDKQAEKLGYATIDVTTKPQGGTVIIDTEPDRPFVAPRQVWVASGYHELSALRGGEPVAGSTFRIAEGQRAVVLIEIPEPATDGGVKEVDFTDDGGETEFTTGPPEDEKFKSLLPDQYLRGVNATGDSNVADAPSRGQVWIGAGFSTPVFGLALALQGRYRLLGSNAQLGVTVEGQGIVGYDGDGFGLAGASAYLTGSFELRMRRIHTRHTLGIGGVIEAVHQAGESGRESGVAIYAETQFGARWSILARIDALLDRFPPENRGVSLLFGAHW